MDDLSNYPGMEHNPINWQLVEETAEKAGVPYFTRRKWRERQRVPAKWWAALVENSDGRLSMEGLARLLPDPSPASEQGAAA